MTDRYCIRAFEALSVPEAFALDGALHRESRERVRDAVDMVDLVGTRVELRRAGANRMRACARSTRSARRRSAIDAAKKLFHCFGCGAGRRRVQVRRGDRGPGLQGRAGVARRALRRRARARGGGPAGGRAAQAARAAARAAGAHGDVLRALPVGVGRGRAARATYLPSAGSTRSTLREFRVGYAPSAWDKVLVASRRAGFSDRELSTPGSADARRQGPRAASTTASAAGSCSRCATRAGACWASARGRWAPTRSRSTSTRSDNEVFHKGDSSSAADIARAAAAKAGEVIVAEGYTDVIALHQAGLRNTVGIMGTALTDEQVGELAAPRARRCCWRSTPTAPGRRRCCAPRASRRAASSSCASCRCRRAATRPTSSQREGAEAVARAGRGVGAVRALPRRARAGRGAT